MAAMLANRHNNTMQWALGPTPKRNNTTFPPCLVIAKLRVTPTDTRIYACNYKSNLETMNLDWRRAHVARVASKNKLKYSTIREYKIKSDKMLQSYARNDDLAFQMYNKTIIGFGFCMIAKLSRPQFVLSTSALTFDFGR